jgi:hypothetical protein
MSYWSLVRKRAFLDARNWLFLDWSGRAAAIALLSIILLWIFGSPGAFKDDFISKFGPVAAIVGVFPLVYIVFFFRAPAALYREQEEKIATLEDQLAPALALRVPNDASRVLQWGSVNRSAGGSAYTNERDRTVLRLECDNTSARRLGCRAEITNLVAIEESGELRHIGFVEPLPLSFSQNMIPCDADIEPYSSKPIFLLYALPTGATHFYVGDAFLPFPCIPMFASVRKCRMTVQVHANAAIGDRIVIDVTIPEFSKQSIGTRKIEFKADIVTSGLGDSQVRSAATSETG